MRRISSVLILAAVSTLAGMQGFAQQAGVEGIADSAAQQSAEILAIKQGFTPAQTKIDANLVFAVKAANGELFGTSASDIAPPPRTDVQGNVTVDIYGNVSAALLAEIASANGVVLDQSDRDGLIHASLPLTAIDRLAAHDDVQSIQSGAEARTNAGSLTSQGYISHAANQVVNMGFNGAGVTVGVL